MHAGSILIYCALALSVLTLLVLARAAGGSVFARVTSQRIFYLGALLVTFATVLLLSAFLVHDFSIGYVYQHSSRDLPLIYRVSALWAGQEGGFLLWLFFLYIIGIVVIRTRDTHESIIMAVVSVTQFFILISLTVKSPFARVWEVNPGQFSALIPTVLDGLGLNPLLQDFWMAVHPPVLFAGYAAAVVPFAYAVAALIKQDYSIMHTRAYRWVIFTAAALGAGIFLGGYWAYAVLGWGGYWGWDPVENSSLVPWLALIALLHGLVVQKRSGALVRTNLVLALLSFMLVLYSTFLTRSGILSNFSVHSFAGEEVSYQIAYYIAFYLVIGIVLFSLRFRGIDAAPLNADIASPGNFIFYGIIILLLFGGMVLLGTSMPILTGIVLGRPAAVNEGFYNTWSVPAACIILLLLAVASLFRGAKFEKVPALALLAASLVAGVLFNIFDTRSAIAYPLAIAAFLAMTALVRGWLRNRAGALLPSRLAHLGVAFLVLGAVATGYQSFTVQKRLERNREESVGSLRIKFLELTEGERSSLKFTVSLGRSVRDIAMPYYFSERTNSVYKEPHITPGILGDLYISPVTYYSGTDIASMVGLRKGESKKVGDVEVRYLGMRNFNMKSMMEGRPELFIDLEVRSGGAVYRVSPGLRMGAAGKLESIGASFSAGKRKVELQHLSRESGEVSLFVEPGRNTPLPPDEVIVEISHKRLIILVWAATLLIAAGLVLALRRTKGFS
jgi:cytochrome c-type biogenesis protein CcmF